MRHLFRHTIIYGLATVLSRGLPLVLLPIYTRILSPTDFGALDMLTVAGALATLVVALEIGQALARLYGEVDETDVRRTMASTALWFSVGAYGTALAAALIGADRIAVWLLGPGMEMPFRIGCVFIAVNGIFYLLQNQLRVELRSAAYLALSLLYAAVTIILSIVLGFALDFGLNGILWAQVLAALISVAGGIWALRDRYTWRVDTNLLTEMLRFSLPLVPSGLATFFTLYANRLLLNSMMGLDAVGLFGVAVRIAGISGLLIIGLQSALTPLIYAHYKEPDTPARLARTFEIFTALALLFCLGLGQFAGEILLVVAEPRYLAAASFVMPLAPAALFSQAYIFFPGIAISRRMYLQLAIFVASGSTSLLANWLLIGAYGLQGAVLATLASSGLFLTLWIYVSQRLYCLPIRWGRLAIVAAAFVIIAAAGLGVTSAKLPELASLALRLLLAAFFAATIIASGLVRLSDIGAAIARWKGRLRPAG